MARHQVQFDLFEVVTQFTSEAHPLFNAEDRARFLALFPGADTLAADWAAAFPADMPRGDILLAGIVLGCMGREALVKHLDRGVGFSRIEPYDLCGRCNVRYHLRG